MFNKQNIICLGLRHVFFSTLCKYCPWISLCQPAKNLKTLDKEPLQMDKVIFYCSESSAAGLDRVCELCNACFHLHIQNFPGRILTPTECDGLHSNF